MVFKCSCEIVTNDLLYSLQVITIGRFDAVCAKTQLCGWGKNAPIFPQHRSFSQMSTGNLIPPHGGKLVCRFADGSLAEEAASLPKIILSSKQACDLEMIAIGAFSPLTGFCKRADFESICKDTRLADGTVWPIPITLAVEEDVKSTLTEGGRAALYHSDGTFMAIIDCDEIYEHDKALEIPNVFGTEDEAHPGAKQVMDEGQWLVGGNVHVATVTPEVAPGEQFTQYRLSPNDTRKLFAENNWKTVAAFQTRKPDPPCA